MNSVPFKSTISIGKEIAYHVLFWLLFCYFTLLDFHGSIPSNLTLRKPDTLTIFWAAVLVISFYFNYLIIMPRVFKKFNWKRAFLGVFGSYLFFVSIRYALEEIMMPVLFGIRNYAQGTQILYYFYDNLYFFTFPLIPSTIFWLIVFLIRLLENNAFIREEKKNMEVKFLKSQLNPHFLFNTLNTIYSMVYTQSDQALPAIEKLSTIMRFTTYEAEKDYVSIENEIDYFTSFIELEKLRHKGGIPTQMKLIHENGDLQIPPLILSPLIENAIKHGVYDENNPIEIRLECNQTELRFEVKNKIGTRKKDAQGGIGLENLKKRLDIYYTKNYILDLNQNNDNFNAKLKILFNGKSSKLYNPG